MTSFGKQSVHRSQKNYQQKVMNWIHTGLTNEFHSNMVVLYKLQSFDNEIHQN